jgi:ribosomal protein L28
MYGHKVSHAKNATNRRFMPNINKRTLVYQGRKQKMNVCANCLRTLHKSS